MSSRAAVAILCSLAGGTLIAGCDGPSSRALAIGVALPAQNAVSASMYRGVELAVSQLNDENAGRGPQLAVRRPPATLTGAVAIAASLRDDPSVVGVVGHQGTSSTMDAAAIYSDAEHGGRNALVAISPIATGPALSGLSPWVFRVCPSDVDVSRAAARYVLDSIGARRAVVIYRNDAFGKDWTRAFISAFERDGGRVLARNPYLTEITEWAAYAEHVRRLRPDVILFPGSSEDAELAVQALRAAGVRLPILGSDNLSALELKPEEYAGVRYTAFFNPARPLTPEGHAFVAAYRRRFGELPDQRAALAYDAALVIGRAARAVGGNRADVRDYVAGVGRAHPAIRGATGHLAFDARNDVVQKSVVFLAVGRSSPPDAGGELRARDLAGSGPPPSRPPPTAKPPGAR